MRIEAIGACVNAAAERMNGAEEQVGLGQKGLLHSGAYSKTALALERKRTSDLVWLARHMVEEPAKVAH